jgi:hypothetical protein
LDRNANTRGRIAFLVVFMFVLLAGAYFTNQIYSNSIDGIAHLIGEFAAPWIVFTAITWKVRRSPYAAAAVLAVAALTTGIVNMGKLQESIAAQEGKAALQGITDPKQIDEALRQHPSNTFLQMMAVANKAAIEANAATEKLSDEIEPAALSKDINLATASRSDLEALRRDLKTAEANAATFMLRYVSLLKAERDKVEKSALSLQVEKNTVSNLLNGVDKRHARTTAFTSKMALGRFELYRAYESYVAVLVEEFGTYKVVNGQFTFPLPGTADRYNVAASAMTAAAKRLSELDNERKQIAQSRQEGWEQFVKSK